MYQGSVESSSVSECSNNDSSHDFVGATPPDEAARSGMDPRIERALKFIESNPTHLLSIDVTAASVSLSSSRLRHLFKAHVGISFHQHLIGVRLSRAKKLIHTTDHPVAHIWQLVGDRDISHFTRDYKRVYGVTPGADRRRRRVHTLPPETAASRTVQKTTVTASPQRQNHIGKKPSDPRKSEDAEPTGNHRKSEAQPRQRYWC